MLLFDSLPRPGVNAEVRWLRNLGPVVFLAVLAAFAVYQMLRVGYEFNADSIYLLTFVRSVMTQGTASGWVIAPAGIPLSEALLTALGLLLGLDGHANVALVFAGFLVFLVLSSSFMLQCAGVQRNRAFVAASGAVLLFAFIEPENVPLSVLLAAPHHHQSALCYLALGLGLELVITTAEADRIRHLTSALAGVVALGVFSDAVLIGHLVLPLVAFAGLTLLRGSRRNALYSIAAAVLGTIVGVGGRKALETVAGVQVGGVAVSFKWADIGASYRNFVSQLPQVLATGGWVRSTFALVATLALLTLAVRWAARTRGMALLRSDSAIRGAGMLSLLTLMATFAAIAIPILAGKWVASASYRYQLPMFWLPFVTALGLGVQFVMASMQLRKRAALVGLAAVGIAALALLLRAPVKGRGFLAKQAALVEGLRQRHPTAVLAEYWDAKPIHVASGYALSVCQLSRNGSIYPWLVDLTWCAEVLGALRQVDSVVAVSGRGFEPLGVVNVFGQPSWSETIADVQVWYYSGPVVRRRLLRSGCKLFEKFDGLSETAHCSES